MQADLGVVGLAVMGQNLVLNMIDHKYTVAIYNRSPSKIEETYERAESKDQIIKAYSLEALVASLSKPRIILVMVKAGPAVDSILIQLADLLSPGDVLIDGGNSNYLDTVDRSKRLAEKGIEFIGMGISGGEYGARYGPSMMPGGSKTGWALAGQIFTTISANYENQPCCVYLGPDGAGHYVKTVHNGIEYADMELIAETYDILKSGFNLNGQELGSIFEKWNSGKLRSYLIEITSDIFHKLDENTHLPLVDLILDSAGQKGTGRWTVHSSLDTGEPLSLIASAVFQRFISSKKILRGKINKHYNFSRQSQSLPPDFTDTLEMALYAAKILSYAQGFALLTAKSEENNWNLNLAEIASIWRAGCIIRSEFLDQIMGAYSKNNKLNHLILDTYFMEELVKAEPALRTIVTTAIKLKIPVPAFSSALAYFDSIRSKILPANLIQAQRDYFGAHGYQLLNDPDGDAHHTDWSR